MNIIMQNETFQKNKKKLKHENKNNWKTGYYLLKAMLKRNVLSLALNMLKSSIERNSVGSKFHSRAPATAKALSPKCSFNKMFNEVV